MNMPFTVALAAYSEIMLKSRPVRRLFEDDLTRNVRLTLKRYGISPVAIRTEGGRLVVTGDNPLDVCSKLSNIFGVDFASPAVVASNALADILNAVEGVAHMALTHGDTFAVRTKRVGPQPYTSKDVEVEAGRLILEKLGSDRNLKVDLTKPRCTISVEIRGLQTYVYATKMHGPGGLPYGTQGKALNLLTCDGRSAVAAWLMMKRGVEVSAVHFTSDDKHRDACLAEVNRLAARMAKFVPSGQIALTMVTFGRVEEALQSIQNISQSDRKILLKRCMLKSASNLAALHGFEALVTGDWVKGPQSLAAKALPFLSEAAQLPIFQPLMGFPQETTSGMALPLGLNSSELRFEEEAAVSDLTLSIEDAHTVEDSWQLNALAEAALDRASEVTITASD
ncbi:MAG: THUMP domain-containing protein [Candidatus Bathyarchaeia archaeon]